jgi:transcriptional regulator with XRE-family HTH domain
LPEKVSIGRNNLMGRATRHIPAHLGEKLALVRESLNVRTFEEMVARLDIKEVNLYRSTIHEYEKGKREPQLVVLLRYSELGGVTMNDLVDDKVILRLSKNRLSRERER